jgi:hypothetical protein
MNPFPEVQEIRTEEIRDEQTPDAMHCRKISWLLQKGFADENR